MPVAAGVSSLLRWVVLSVLLHGLMLLIFTDFLRSTVTVSPQAQLTTIEAILLSKSEGQPGISIAPAAVSHPDPEPSRLSVPVSPVSRATREKIAPVATELAVPAPSYTQSTQSADGEALINEGRDKPVEAISQDGLREYRLNLSREARRYKRYPALARQRGLEGVVVVVVSTRAGLALPQVSLSQSSGQEILDHQALEMLGLAVQAARFPESLRGRDFAIDLPIHFSLEE